MVDISDIRAAAGRLAPVVRRTPLLESPFLNEIAGRRVLVKAECLQHTGSFKFRGAWSAISALEPEVRARGVFAYSSGNHAQGVAYAAKLHGIPAAILMPADAPKLKLANTAAYGAEVITYDRYTESREEIGARLAAERGLTLVRPYDEPMVIAGQGTAGLELAEQAAEAGVREGEVLVCTGGGGLASGVAMALAAEAPGLRVRPVEPEGWNDWQVSLASGERTPAAGGRATLCDAIVTPAPGEITWPILSKLAGSGLAVSDEDCLFAMAQAFERLKIVIEPGGAAALAAALRRPDQIAGDAVLVLATGGNVDRDVFLRALQAAAG